MIRKLALAIIIAAVLGAGLFWWLTIPEVVVAASLPPHKADLANGREMFLAGGCASCHATPNKNDKQNDRTHLGGGMALASPFGTFYPPNISSDAKDGIGGWTEAQFVTAMTKGTSPSGQHLYPAFPYTSYRHMRRSDLRDLFAYLKTLPAVQGRVRGHDLPFPFGFRRGIGLWKLLYLDGAPFTPDPTKSAQWNRGAYLVNGPGHCAECHSPRNALGAVIAGQRFSGGASLDGHGRVPAITQAKLKDWSEADLVEVLTTGYLPNFDRVSGPMREVVDNTSQLTKEDRAAMAAYLKSLPSGK
jgi:mono/diheme cytochrome c family protein